MQMKTFRAATSTAAFEKIKAELGDDAVILSNKTISDNGSKCCEIVAAIDTAPVAPKRQSKEAIVEDALENTVGWQREWSQIKGQIMALMKPQIDLNALSPKQRIAMEYLEREDADETVMTRIFCDLREDKNKSILPVLESLINVKAFNTHNWSGTFHAFAGPGGAGKTSSLVRLALKEKKKNPKARICLATADGGRGKGRIVLKHYAELSALLSEKLSRATTSSFFKKKPINSTWSSLTCRGFPARQHLKNGPPCMACQRVKICQFTSFSTRITAQNNLKDSLKNIKVNNLQALSGRNSMKPVHLVQY